MAVNPNLPALCPENLDRDKLLFLKVKSNVDDLFHLIFSSAKFHAKYAELSEVTNYVSTEWLQSNVEVPKGVQEWDDNFSFSTDKPPSLTHRYRKFRLKQGGNEQGESERTEFQQVTEFNPGRRYVVECRNFIPGRDKLFPYKHYIIAPEDSVHSLLLVTMVTDTDPAVNSLVKYLLKRKTQASLIQSYEIWKNAVSCFVSAEVIPDDQATVILQGIQRLPPLKPFRQPRTPPAVTAAVSEPAKLASLAAAPLAAAEVAPNAAVSSASLAASSSVAAAAVPTAVSAVPTAVSEAPETSVSVAPPAKVNKVSEIAAANGPAVVAPVAPVEATAEPEVSFLESIKPKPKPSSVAPSQLSAYSLQRNLRYLPRQAYMDAISNRAHVQELYCYLLHPRHLTQLVGLVRGKSPMQLKALTPHLFGIFLTLVGISIALFLLRFADWLGLGIKGTLVDLIELPTSLGQVLTTMILVALLNHCIAYGLDRLAGRVKSGPPAFFKNTSVGAKIWKMLMEMRQPNDSTPNPESVDALAVIAAATAHAQQEVGLSETMEEEALKGSTVTPGKEIEDISTPPFAPRPLRICLDAARRDKERNMERFKSAVKSHLRNTSDDEEDLDRVGSWGNELASEVEEEIYEYERYQPFFGWGHSWPGHFLISDRVAHWGDCQGFPCTTASMVREEVEPELPPGWCWGGSWEVDLSGVAENRVDKDGWQYALDFFWLTFPPNEGSGENSLRSCVRCRRWVRKRVRSSTSAVAEKQVAAAKPSAPRAEARTSVPKSSSAVRAATTASKPPSSSLPARVSSMPHRSSNSTRQINQSAAPNGTKVADGPQNGKEDDKKESSDFFPDLKNIFPSFKFPS